MKHIKAVPDNTHFPGCWRYHHYCALAEIGRLRRQVEAARYLIAQRGDGTDGDMTRRLIAIDRVLDPPKVGEQV